jgi:hypothetical protein
MLVKWNLQITHAESVLQTQKLVSTKRIITLCMGGNIPKYHMRVFLSA